MLVVYPVYIWQPYKIYGIIVTVMNSSCVVNVRITQLPHGVGLPLPTYGTASSAGLDLLAANEAPITVNPGERCLVPSGIAIALPEGYEAQIRSRSGLSLKNGIIVLNAPGTIDADYRGEIIGIMANVSNESFTITRGMRFAQMVITTYTKIDWQFVATLDENETSRGSGGFGSTGLIQTL